MPVLLFMSPAKDSSDTVEPSKKRSQTNPRSLANLTGHKEQYYEQPKKTRNLSITDDGWQGLAELAKSVKLSRSEFVESLGRGSINLHVAIKELTSSETLVRLGLTPNQVLEMSVLELLRRIAQADKR